MKLLAEEARKENLAMRRLTEKTTQDAAAVKVLTIITLIYLPATVVSVSSSIFIYCFPKSFRPDIDTIEFLLDVIC